MSAKLEALFRSRRFYAAILAILVVVMREHIDLGADEAKAVVAIISAWLLGDSLSKTS